MLRDGWAVYTPVFKLRRNQVLKHVVNPVDNPVINQGVPRLLIVLDAHETVHAGLNRVKELPSDAVRLQIDLYIDRSSTSTTLSIPAGDEAHMPAETAWQAPDKGVWLALQVQPLRDLGYSLDIAVIEFEHLHESIIERATVLGVDCVLKSLGHHGVLRQLLFSEADWLLVRQCLIPLWLVSQFDRLKGKPVLAAVNVVENDQPHLAHNQRLLQQAAALADLLHGSLHMVNACDHESPTVLAQPLAVQAMENLLLDQMAVALQAAFEHQIDSQRIHCERGSVARVVNYVSQQIDAGVIVVGSTSRRGGSQWVEGSVAEAVMAATDSDVLLVKPGKQSLSISGR